MNIDVIYIEYNMNWFLIDLHSGSSPDSAFVVIG